MTRFWLWNMTDPAHPARLGQPLTGPADSVHSVAFSPTGQILAAASGDGKVWLWNMTDPAHPARLGQPLTGPANSVNSVAFSPRRQILAAGTGDDTVQLWNFNIDYAIKQICTTTSNTITPAQWRQYIPLPYDPPCAHPGHYGFLLP